MAGFQEIPCVLLLFICLSQFICVKSAHIVFYHHISSHSHRVVSYPLANALEKRGHSVTFISPFQPPGPYVNPNITEIIPKKFAATMEAFLAADFDINMRIQKKLESNAHAYFPTGVTACKDLLEAEEFHSFLKSTKTIDLLILDDLITECAMFLKHKYGAKHMFLNTIVFPGYEFDMYGINPDSSSVPELILNAPQVPMSFLDRAHNVIASLYFRHVHYSFYGPQIDALIRKYPGFEDMPYVDDIFRDTSLVLSMGDMVTDHARSLPPMVVNVGGLHCRKDRMALPKELEQFIGDKESTGFVYMSLGSLVVSSNLPEDVKQVLFQTMEKFPKLRFLWKWNGPFPDKKTLPKNLHLGKWFPQQDLLGHPKIKAFITQSGRPSILEAVCAAVPMITFPAIGDQDANANRVGQMGGSVVLDFGKITVPGMVAIIQNVMSKEAKERMERLRNIHEDQPMSPLDTAVWWTEYVLRHPDTEHLKPAGFHQWWFQRRLVDVWAFFFAVFLLLAVIVLSILKFIFRILLCRENRSVKSSKKKN